MGLLLSLSRKGRRTSQPKFLIYRRSLFLPEAQICALMATEQSPPHPASFPLLTGAPFGGTPPPNKVHRKQPRRPALGAWQEEVARRLGV